MVRFTILNSRIKIGETEIVWDNLNPDFAKSFAIDFIFETV